MRRGKTLSDGRRLSWWIETLLVISFYAVYSFIRNVSEGSAETALLNAERIIEAQRSLGSFFEPHLHSWALEMTPLIVAMNYFYGSLHFVVTAGTIVFLFRRFPDHYPLWRNTLATTTGLGLVGFVLFPLMPPRLLPERLGHRFVDTLAEYPTIWSFDSGAVEGISNQFAAMPSLHFAWALFCALALIPRVRNSIVRWALGLYPVVTLFAIVVTANHFWLDAAGGAAALGLGYVAARRFTRAGRTVWDTRARQPG